MRYGTVYFDLAKDLDVTAIEFLYLWMVHGLSNKPKYEYWCIMANKEVADMLGVSIRTVQNMTQSLAEKGLLLKGSGTKKRVSEDFADALFSYKSGYAESAPIEKLKSNVQNLHTKRAKSAPQSVQNLHTKRADFAPNNNKIIIEDNNKYINTSSSISKNEIDPQDEIEQFDVEEIEQEEQQEKQPSLKAERPKKEKEKSSAKKEKEKAEPAAWKRFVEVYDQFHVEQTTLPLAFVGKNTAALKTIWAALMASAKMKAGTEADQEDQAILILEYIAGNWHKLNTFLQNQVEPCKFSSNLPSIMQAFKSKSYGNTGEKPSRDYKIDPNGISDEMADFITGGTDGNRFYGVA